MCGKSRRQDTKQKKGLCVKRQKNSCHYHLPAYLLDLILIFRFFLLKLNQKASKEDSTSPSTHKMSRHLKILGKILSSHSQQADGEGKKEEKKKKRQTRWWSPVWESWQQCVTIHKTSHTKKKKWNENKFFFSFLSLPTITPGAHSSSSFSWHTAKEQEDSHKTHSVRRPVRLVVWKMWETPIFWIVFLISFSFNPLVISASFKRARH